MARLSGRTDIATLLPAGVAVCWMAIGGEPPALYPEELAAVSRAVPARRLEFATGRACARRALADLGVGPVAIPVGPGRAPVWPDEVVGAISHASGQCVAATGRSTQFAGIGIDLERNQPLPPGTLDLVTTEAERGWIRAGSDEVALDALVFSIKEAVFKAWFPIKGTWLGFGDAEVDVDLATWTFGARLAEHAEPGPYRDLTGRFTRCGELVVSGLAIPARGGAGQPC